MNDLAPWISYGAACNRARSSASDSFSLRFGHDPDWQTRCRLPGPDLSDTRVTQQSGLHLRVPIGVVAGQQRVRSTAVFGQSKFSSNLFSMVFFEASPAVAEECQPRPGLQYWRSLSPIPRAIAPLSFGTRHHRDRDEMLRTLLRCCARR
jgi:hypothetical protein